MAEEEIKQQTPKEAKPAKETKADTEETKIETPKEGLASEMGEVKEIEQVIVDEVKEKPSFEKEGWNPKTSLGKMVKEGKVTDINYALDRRIKILEPEIVEALIPNLQTDLLMVGQSKGKFGGGQKRVFKQTQKKTQEGNKPKFATFAVVGNEDGYVGIGYGKSKETVPAREKAIRNAKLNVIKIRRGNGTWQDSSREPNTIPFAVEGKCGSVHIKLLPAPRGTGLKVDKECQKILKLAGIKDVWSKTQGQTKTKLNLLMACFEALNNLVEFKISQQNSEKLGVVEGIKAEA